MFQCRLCEIEYPRVSFVNLVPDKAKPSVRRGRKAAGFLRRWPSCRRMNLLVVRLFVWNSRWPIRQKGGEFTKSFWRTIIREGR